MMVTRFGAFLQSVSLRSSIIAARSSATRKVRRAIEAGRIPEAWTGQPAKLARKDRDARWTVKWSKAKPPADGSPRIDLAVPAFGYKNHVGIDRRHGLLRTWAATDAARHDGAQLANLEPSTFRRSRGRRSAVEHVFARQKRPMSLVVRDRSRRRTHWVLGTADRPPLRSAPLRRPPEAPVVERTLAWISRCRRLARDYERHARKTATFVRLAMIRLMLRRLSIKNL
jgi:hypothetical protein